MKSADTLSDEIDEAIRHVDTKIGKEYLTRMKQENGTEYTISFINRINARIAHSRILPNNRLRTHAIYNAFTPEEKDLLDTVGQGRMNRREVFEHMGAAAFLATTGAGVLIDASKRYSDAAHGKTHHLTRATAKKLATYEGGAGIALTYFGANKALFDAPLLKLEARAASAARAVTLVTLYRYEQSIGRG